MRTLQSALPNLTTIDRDFSAHNTTAWLPNSGLITRSPITSPLAVEADLIPSPSTGLILTTLQQIRQKPLPGQKSKPAIRERVEKVSLRYETLVVLVSEGLPANNFEADGHSGEDSNGLDEQGSLAFAEFAGFCASLRNQTSIVVYFVAGGEATLGKWIASIICEVAPSFGLQIYNESTEMGMLLSDETSWELFLRRVGMNAYAAQAVLGQMKAPQGVDVGSPSKRGLFGIMGFVEMAQAEREARFGNIMGGTRVLERVGRLFDGNWEGRF
jgi:hypothetical protein